MFKSKEDRAEYVERVLNFLITAVGNDIRELGTFVQRTDGMSEETKTLALTALSMRLEILVNVKQMLAEEIIPEEDLN